MPPSPTSSGRRTGRPRRSGSDERLRRSLVNQAQALERGRTALGGVATRRDAAWRASAETSRKRARAVLLAPFSVGLVFLLLGLVSLVLLVVGLVLLVVWGIVAASTWKAAKEGSPARLGGLEVREAVAAGLVSRVESERYLDVAQSLCDALGLELPGLFVLDDPALNSIATGTDDSARIYVTTGLLSRLERIELEGVLAHELAHLKRLDTLTAGLSAGLLRGGSRPLPGAPRLARYLEGPGREVEADMAGVQVTRYPPGLIKAIEVASEDPVPQRAVRQSVLAETASQWLVAPLPSGPASEGGFGSEERLGALREL